MKAKKKAWRALALYAVCGAVSTVVSYEIGFGLGDNIVLAVVAGVMIGISASRWRRFFHHAKFSQDKYDVKYCQDAKYRFWLYFFGSLDFSLGRAWCEAVLFTNRLEGAKTFGLIVGLAVALALAVFLLDLGLRHTNKMQRQYLVTGVVTGFFLTSLAKILTWLGNADPEIPSLIFCGFLLWSLDICAKDRQELWAYREFFSLPCLIIFGNYLRSGFGLNFYLFTITAVITTIIVGSTFRFITGKSL